MATWTPLRTVVKLGGHDELVIEHREPFSREEQAELEASAARLYEIAGRTQVLLLAVGPASNVAAALEGRDAIATLRRTLRDARITITGPAEE